MSIINYIIYLVVLTLLHNNRGKFAYTIIM